MPRILLTPEQKLANKRASNQRWAEANREKARSSNQRYEAANKARIAQARAAARLADPEKFRARSRDWRECNPDKAALHSARRYIEHKDEFLGQIKRWREENPERLSIVLQQGRKRRAPKRRLYANERYATNIQARIAALVRNRLRKALKGAGAASVIKALGCSIAELVIHLESRFADGMSWANQGEWHIDHIKPLAGFDLTDQDQFAKACHFTNLQPLWGSENQSKGCGRGKTDPKLAKHPMD